ncbi:hypothetical protein P691DRAFT_767097, partial [Macrolepiota fuliginosa MF-IS2]
MSSIEQFLVSDTFLNKLAGKIGQSAPAQPVGQQQNAQRRPLANCGGCSDPNHFFRACPKMADYLQRGVCVRDNSNRICFPDGTLVTPQAAPGKNLTERIDNWHSARAGPPPTVQTNILEAAPVQQFSFNTQYTPPTSQLYLQQNTAFQDEKELQILDTVTVAALKRKEEIQNRT